MQLCGHKKEPLNPCSPLNKPAFCFLGLLTKIKVSITYITQMDRKSKPQTYLHTPTQRGMKEKTDLGPGAPRQVMLREASLGTGAAANHPASDCNLEVSLHQKIRMEMLKGEAVFWQPPNVQSISTADSIQAV